ncbi:RND efflux system, outer membrane lipoprotein CmeC [Micavibrio aeruginosavorus EPB]|uniref:RND efflux system, outer membrane lipoprotein CmeC n=1 Tax=Micavibrio aeruginosavorus EPB TaxID=349215 RepID=M4VK93_9BACT|nr:RND efflux system, outer membrane lipoprotein CmeC [Micavibrio aeruginosavorus EPB]
MAVSAEWPQGQAYAGGMSDPQASISAVTWQSFFQSPQMQQIIQTALENNRDLRVAALRVEQARAVYRVERSALVPSVNAGGSMTRQGVPENASMTGQEMTTSTYSANVGITAFELDLFGRVRSMNEKALQEYFATEEAQSAARIALIAETANAYLTYLADKKLLTITEDTLKAQQESYNLIVRRHDLGISSLLDLEQARTSVETARANRVRYIRLVAQDRNALELLMGAKSDEAALDALTLDTVELAEILPVGLPSAVMLERPDIRQAEHTLQAANANIGAARAAFFPTISLTGSAGLASESLSDLFKSGSSLAWSFVPQITVPIFSGGRNVANLDNATATQKIAVAQYDKAIQTAFREVSDELAARGTYTEQLAAQTALVTAAGNAYKISRARYEQGIDSYLNALDSQRQLYNAQQSEIAVQQERLVNFVTLYKVLGGGKN